MFVARTLRCSKGMSRTLLLLFASLAITSTAEARPRHVVKIEKAKRKLTLEVDGRVVRTFRVGLGFAPEKDKTIEGDGRTPEGRFYVAWKNPGSQFHRFFGLSYPMPRHARKAHADGRITKKVLRQIERAAANKKKPPQYTGLGGLVGVHGGGGGSDWTLGCIAISDEEIEWLYAQVRVGDEIVVLP